MLSFTKHREIFDIHHGIKFKYWNFQEWVQKNRTVLDLVGLMDVNQSMVMR